MIRAVVDRGDKHPPRAFDLDDGLAMMIGANQAAIIDEVGVVGGVLEPVGGHVMTPATVPER